MALANFEAALDIVLRFEGGYVDHPADPGGATNRGITRATLAKWRGRPVSKDEVRALSREEAGAIYRATFWNAVRADDLPAGLDLAMFDLAVNSGPARAIRLLERVLGLPEDGRIGPRLLAGAATRGAEDLVMRLCAERRAFLKGLSTFTVFGRGWLARVAGVERHARAMSRATGAPPPPNLSPTPQPQEKNMDTTKSILTSRTLWANAIGLVSIGLAAFGFNTSGLDAGALTDHLFQAVAAGSFVVSSVFRVLATKRLA